MKSIGIYYNKQGNNQKLFPCFMRILKCNSYLEKGKKPEPIELHINLWKCSKHSRFKSSKNEFLLDFGLKMDADISRISIYFPFKIVLDQIEDLGEALMSDRDLLCLLFNANMQITAAKTDCYSMVMNQDTNEKFFLYQLGSQNFNLDYIATDNNCKSEDATLLHINRSLPEENNENMRKSADKIYLRFRIRNPNMEAFRTIESLQNDILQNAFSQIEMFDIRINDKREINKKVMENVRANGYKPFEFNKIHFFYMAQTRENIRNSGFMKMDSRLLELKKWETYLKGYDITQPYISYHWKCKAEGEKSIKDFSLFISSIYPKYNFFLMFAYLSIVILLGWLGSMLSFVSLTDNWITIKFIFLFILLFVSIFGIIKRS